MQNDRGRFRCYRYCSIGERRRCDGSARPTIFGFLSSGRSSPNSLQRVKCSDLNRTNRQHETSHTYRQCGGAYVVSCPEHYQIQFDPEDISLDLADDIKFGPRVSRVVSDNDLLRSLWSSDLHVHFECSLRRPGKIERDRWLSLRIATDVWANNARGRVDTCTRRSVDYQTGDFVQPLVRSLARLLTRGDIPRVCQRAWTTVANSAAVRRTHIWQRRYQSRSDDWLYRSLRRYVLRGGGKANRERERESEREREMEWWRGEGGQRGWRTEREKRTRGVDCRSRPRTRTLRHGAAP